MSAILDFLFGAKPKAEQLAAFSPQQTQFQNQLLGSLGGQGFPAGLQALMKLLGQDEQSMQEFAAPYMRQFKTGIVPSITERFGGGDSGASSGLYNALGEAGKGLEESIFSGRQQMQSQALNQLFGLINPAMQSPFGYASLPGTTGAVQSLLMGIGGMGRR